MYYRDSNAVLFVYDICDPKSFENVEYFWSDYRDHQATNSQVVMMLVGNKSDKVRDRCVSTEQGEALAKKLGAEFLETSAKSGENISKLFDIIADKLISSETSEQSGENHKLVKGLDQHSGCC
jgi:small GTP-binding protein